MKRDRKLAYLLDVIEQTSTFFDRLYDRREVVVSQNHFSGVFSDVDTSTHSHTDISLFERR